MEWSDFDFMVWRHEWRYQCQKYFFRHNLQWSFLIRCKNFTILNISKFKKIFSKSSPFWGPGELINQKWNWKLSLTRYPVQFPTFWAPVPAKKLTELWQFQNMWFSDDWWFCSWVIWEFANTQTNKHTNRHTVGHIYQNVNFGTKFWQVIICFFTTGFFGFSSTENHEKEVKKLYWAGKRTVAGSYREASKCFVWIFQFWHKRYSNIGNDVKGMLSR